MPDWKNRLSATLRTSGLFVLLPSPCPSRLDRLSRKFLSLLSGKSRHPSFPALLSTRLPTLLPHFTHDF